MILLWSLMLFHFCVLSHCPENLHHLFRTIILWYQLSNGDDIANITSLVRYCFSYYMCNLELGQYSDRYFQKLLFMYGARCKRLNRECKGLDSLVISLQVANGISSIEEERERYPDIIPSSGSNLGIPMHSVST